MAKKKATHQPKDATNQEEEATQQTQTQNHNNNNTAAAASMGDVSSEKLANLKSLNSLLLKETLDRRQQVEALVKAQKGLESELSKLGMEKKLMEVELVEKSDEGFGVELEKTVFGVFVAAQMAEMLREKAEIERVKRGTEEEVEVLRREVDELVGSLENEKGKLSRVCWERDVVKGDFDGLALEANGLRLKVVEMERRERCVEDQVEKVKSQCRGLVEEKCEKERVVEAMMRERDLAERKRGELESVIADLKREIGRIVREKNEIDKAKIGQEVMVSKLEKEVGQLNKVGLSLRTENEGLQKKVSELEESVGEAAAKEREMEREIKALVEEKKEKEDSVERLNEEVKSQKAILDMVTEELENKEQRIKEITQKKNEIEEAKANRDSEVAELSRQVGEQRDVIFTLRKSCNEKEEKNARLVSEVCQYKDAVERVKQERAEVQKSLAEQKKIVEDLKLIVSEREKKVQEIEQLLGKLRTERDDITEKNNVMESRLESLAKEKDFVQKSLSDAQRDIHDWKFKYESAGRTSKQALTMLKNTAAFLASQSEGKKEVAIKEKNLGEEVQPYAAELDIVQSAFRNNEKMIEDLKQQLESVRSVAQAQKRKSFWTLVSSATTIIAAASVAYAAKGR
ncbi:hypothetical protein RchiOBHm_Chr3g0453461 [Rosa chinensis]|uniref:Uncharacterized protein n=1 Tax=Rosa chinensis TaxID=74649 RepID=A0A2P6R6J5_ROSCH|nr:myosin heavy chain, skeletal muscle [Rosa chinensis]PRQ42054.1 hypothetical protein RchiOBHm_Chr3g0453461 [Rosa chinensis]